MRPSTIATRGQVTGMGVVLLLLAMAGCAEAVPKDVLQKLPDDQARQLSVYSKNHSVIFDLRIHSMDTCPFLTYMPNAMSIPHDSKEWATWQLHYYTCKHNEEHDLYHCNCEKELSAPPEPTPPAKK